MLVPIARNNPPIQRLTGFIAAHGYRAAGEHEEDYVRGPGMIFAGNPGNYLTIIRLHVEKVQVYQ